MIAPRRLVGSSPEAGTISTIISPIITPEVSSGELVGMLGFRYRLRERMFFTFGVSYDNNHAILLRPASPFISIARDEHAHNRVLL